MTRSIWKGPFVHPSLLKKIDKLKDGPNKKPIKTWSRNSTIIPDFVGHSFMIHNGKTFIPITISEEMVGHKLVNLHQQEHLKAIHLQTKRQLQQQESKPATGDKKIMAENNFSKSYK